MRTFYVYIMASKTGVLYVGMTNNIKSWRREKKVNLIDTKNPAWTDLAEDWY